jgi:hypothetical protein
VEQNNLLHILKTLTEMMHCPHCGEVYSLDEVQYISQVDGYCLLQVSCKKCRIPIWVNFFIEKNEIKQKPTFNMQLLLQENLEPITTDEVVDFHQMVRSFDGNFKKVFN